MMKRTFLAILLVLSMSFSATAIYDPNNTHTSDTDGPKMLKATSLPSNSTPADSENGTQVTENESETSVQRPEQTRPEPEVMVQPKRPVNQGFIPRILNTIRGLF
ncbi:hypothetical protein [Candidatus Nanohalococcus occultus]|uniref:Secreted protein n=1 Tax=Candidatus Nanohalococcus occultus TaxID=2978047 RepID=A0ABY8CEX1_9ARCH|nr:hypothetical protein SVXNc_0764 [Candidatus Nanohaloarchaeota archaeon SVXNc]